MVRWVFLINWRGINEEVIVLALAWWGAISAVENKWMILSSKVGRGWEVNLLSCGWAVSTKTWEAQHLLWEAGWRSERWSTLPPPSPGGLSSGPHTPTRELCSLGQSHHTPLNLSCPQGLLWRFSSDAWYHTYEPRKHYAKWNEPDTEGQNSYDSIYIKYLE